MRTQRLSFNKKTSNMKKQLCSRVVNETKIYQEIFTKERVIDPIWGVREALGGGDH